MSKKEQRGLEREVALAEVQQTLSKASTETLAKVQQLLGKESMSKDPDSTKPSEIENNESLDISSPRTAQEWYKLFCNLLGTKKATRPDNDFVRKHIAEQGQAIEIEAYARIRGREIIRRDGRLGSEDYDLAEDLLEILIFELSALKKEEKDEYVTTTEKNARALTQHQLWGREDPRK